MRLKLRGPGAAALFAVLSWWDATTPAWAEFISGADVSHLAYFESYGVTYRDNGQELDGMVILKNHGLNCVRLRLFTSSAAQAQSNPYNYINNLDYTVPLAVRARNAGLRFLLDFHYSDTWADPGDQLKPAAWNSMPFAQLVQQMRSYNSNCIAAFMAAGAMPDYVQVGNEIIGGMLWEDGRVGSGSDSVQFPKLAQLMNAAIQGIQDAAGAQMPKIIVHIDRGGDWGATQWFFDNLTNQAVPFDMIGQSYYPFWHGTLTALSNCLSNTARRYGKPVVIAETDFPWIYSTNIFGIPASTNGQVQFVAELAKIVKSLPGGLGGGIVWWGSEYQLPNANQAGFGTRSFFNTNANVMPVADAFGALVAPVAIEPGLSGPNLTLRWPLSGAGMKLRTTTNLVPAGVWTLVTNAPQNTGTLFSVTLPLDASLCRFYRLQSN